jgi:predicted phage terminase large subunit-like protein
MGGDMIIIDDPQKPQEVLSEALRNKVTDWLPNTLLTRLNDKGTGTIILVAQRIHMSDLSGFLMNERKGWHVLSLPAIAEVDEEIQIGENKFYHRKAGEALHPARESAAALERLKQELGPDVFAAQYQQSPVPIGGNMIDPSWIRYYTPSELPHRTARSKIIMTIDTAAKDGARNDYSAILILQLEDGVFHVRDVIRRRFQYPLLRSTVIELTKQYKPDWVLIEDASTGVALQQELKPLLRRPVVLVKVEQNKALRLYVQQHKFAAGLVRLPKGSPFTNDFLRELLTFPEGPHDDQVDALTLALNYKFSTYTLDNVREKPAA